jgi:hypothetical protein
MVAQLSFASLDFVGKKKRTKRDVFLAEMAAVVPWSALGALIEPNYSKASPKGGRRPFPVGSMLRIYCLQQWDHLSDPGAEEALSRCAPQRRAINGTSHIGVDAKSVLVHTAGVTSGSVHDAKVMDRLIRDDDTAVYGDKGYVSDAKKRAAAAAARYGR